MEFSENQLEVEVMSLRIISGWKGNEEGQFNRS